MPSEQPSTKAAPARPRMTQAERSAESERRIIEAAVELIGEKGLVRLTLAEIGEKAGYSRGQPAHIFGTKANLLVQVTRKITETRVERMSAIDPAGGLDSLFEAIRTWLRLVEDHTRATSVYYILVGETYYSDSDECYPEIKRIVQANDEQVRRQFATYFRNAIDKGEIPADIDPLTQARFVFAVLRGLVSQWLTDSAPVDLRSVGRTYMEDLRRQFPAAPKPAK
jgi:AcrR family transcriptional regulator